MPAGNCVEENASTPNPFHTPLLILTGPNIDPFGHLSSTADCDKLALSGTNAPSIVVGNAPVRPTDTIEEGDTITSELLRYALAESLYTPNGTVRLEIAKGAALVVATTALSRMKSKRLTEVGAIPCRPTETDNFWGKVSSSTEGIDNAIDRCVGETVGVAVAVLAGVTTGVANRVPTGVTAGVAVNMAVDVGVLMGNDCDSTTPKIETLIINAARILKQKASNSAIIHSPTKNYVVVVARSLELLENLELYRIFSRWRLLLPSLRTSLKENAID